MMKNSIICAPKPGQAAAATLSWLRLAAIFCLLSLLLPACAQAQDAGDNFLHPPTKAPTPTLFAPNEIDLASQLDAQGRALAPLTLAAPDGCLHLEIDRGTVILNAAGRPANRLVIQQDYPGKLPMQAYGVPISYAYRFGPEELKFSAPAKIVFTCLKNFKKTLLTEMSLGLQSDGGQWDQLSVQGDDQQVWTRLEDLKSGWRYLLIGPAPMGS